MWQQIIALIIILFFLSRLVKQKAKKEVNASEFFVWLFFWLLAALAIIFLKQIDALLANLGFSGSGINFLLYLAVVILFYFIFRLRLRLAKQEKEITTITQALAIKEAEEE
jgi:hypothetical protein